MRNIEYLSRDTLRMRDRMDIVKGTETGQAASARSYGTAEVTPEGIDLSQLRLDLQLTPLERLRKCAKLSRFVLKYQGKLSTSASTSP